MSQLVLVVALVDLGIGVRIIFLVIQNNRHFLLTLVVRMDTFHTSYFINFIVQLKELLFYISKLQIMYIDFKLHTLR